MCKFYSAIVMKNGDLLHNENLTSHEDLIDLFGINDSQNSYDKFVRVEFCPKDETDLADMSKYVLNVDESITPDWFEKHREYVTERLSDIVKKRIITGNLSLLTGGLYVVKDAQIDRVKSAIVVYMQNSTVNEMWGNSTVNEMRGNSTVNAMWENSTVNVMWQNSTVNVMWGNSTVNAMLDNSTVKEMRENSTVNEMRGNSTVKEMRGNSTVNEMWGNSTVNEMRGNSTVKYHKSSKSLPKK
jgi:hypothetical protein